MKNNLPKRKRLRHPKWNYGHPADYFITISTYKHQEFFGEIIDGKMFLNELGKKVEEEWLKSVEIRKSMNISLGEYQVMPNHFHGIITIGANEFNSWRVMWEMLPTEAFFERVKPRLIHPPPGNPINRYRENISSIIRAFKAAVTVYAQTYGPLNFKWHKSFNDVIIRDKIAYEKISAYIRNNPANWEKDRFTF